MTDLFVETSGPVTTFIRTRPGARNAMNPEGAQALHDALLAFEADDAPASGCCGGRAAPSAPGST